MIHSGSGKLLNMFLQERKSNGDSAFSGAPLTAISHIQ